MALNIHHDSAAREFTVEVDGYAGVLNYDLRGDTMTVTHTLVPEAIGGRGLAAGLMRGARETPRAEGGKVVPVCW
jgi:predicted GNAT family acetyltransferase